MSWPRRALPLIGLLPGTGAVAEPVLPLHPPCPTRAGDLVGLIAEGPAAAGVAVFGHPFRRGDLPEGAGLAARLGDGRAVPAQLDVTARHADGSARHAVVSLGLPALP
ncbi:MAG: hypothetical protein K2X11_16330, partial [Acetobacteraceae bacterium]|nr:hypothetical protein [Acetobacteraceae bacterium]